MLSRMCSCIAVGALLLLGRPVAGVIKPTATADSQLLTRVIAAKSLAQTRIGTDPNRSLLVYLPAGHDGSSERYPVIYYLPNALDGFRVDFDKHDARALFDRAIASGIIGKVIIVTPDLSTPVGCSWYVNSPVTGNWEDFVLAELIPYVDANFKTLANRSSRGIMGDRMGGYGAIRFGMRHPEVFGSVYALHPVGTGTGVQTMHSRPDWEHLSRVRSIDELRGDAISNIFLSIYQAALPNPDRPPLYVDLPAHRSDGRLAVDSELTARLIQNFTLRASIAQYAQNLKSLRGFELDWGRSDPNHDHVYANQAFTHELDEFGIPHEAEEYRGGWGDRVWGDDGRIYTDALPFFRRHLATAPLSPK